MIPVICRAPGAWSYCLIKKNESFIIHHQFFRYFRVAPANRQFQLPNFDIILGKCGNLVYGNNIRTMNSKEQIRGQYGFHFAKR